MIERKPLKGTILLCGESDGKRFTRRFQIVHIMKGAAAAP